MDTGVVSTHEKSHESSPEIVRDSISTSDYNQSPTANAANTAKYFTTVVVVY